MNIKIQSDKWQVASDKMKTASPVTHHPSLVTRHSRQGMALVITLILLSVTLVMALALLALARRERNAVTSSTDTTTARLAADSALAAVQSQIIASFITSNSAAYNFGLVVSANYINTNGFNPTFLPSIANPANVNYYYGGGLPLSLADYQQNIANLQIQPRAPVFVVTNAQTGAMDFRFYLDLNRNGLFDDTVNGNVGDPQWIGVLAHPELPHSANNLFVARYAFFAMPVGNALDLNYIHNQVLNPSLGIADGFLRNQGVGSWEINLAAFLADLNTNLWGQIVGSGNSAPLGAPNYYLYNYGANRGVAFDDARALLAWRYNYNYNGALGFASSIFANNGVALQNGSSDLYPFGPPQTNTTMQYYLNNPNNRWPGGETNTAHFFDLTSDLFNPAKSSATFTNRLMLAGTYNNGTSTSNFPDAYDQYTFYRMLGALGTDTTPDDAGKMDLNYDNLHPFVHIDVVSGGTVTNPPSATNLMAWTPLSFFTNAADRMLRHYTTNWFVANPTNFLETYYNITPNNYVAPNGYGLTSDAVPAFGISHIPVYVNGAFVYSPAVNRLLQLAANIYDASTTNFYPSVFHPIFNKDQNGNVFISGYEQIVSVSASDLNVGRQLDVPVPVSGLLALNVFPTGINVAGVPWIIGAKKYMPNFNEFYSFNTVQVSRKLQINRKPQDIGNPYNITTSGDYTTNEQYLVSITNHFGFSFWNSYTASYPGGFPTVFMRDKVQMALLNNGAYTFPPPGPQFFIYNPTLTNLGAAWPGSAWDTSDPGSRQVNNTGSFVTGTFDYPLVPGDSLLFDSPGNLEIPSFSAPGFNPATTYVSEFPQLNLMTTNVFQAFILDGNHVIDYVQFNGPFVTNNLAAELQDPDGPNDQHSNPYLWSTNRNTLGAIWGVQNQMNVSQNPPAYLTQETHLWTSPGNMPVGLNNVPQAEASWFQAFFTGGYVNGQQNTNLVQQAPFTPTRTVISPTEMVVNDPLVHYLVSDLNGTIKGLNANNNIVYDDPSAPPNTAQPPSLNSVASRYQPWGRKTQLAGVNGADTNAYNLTYKDPLVYGSDNWDFPGNKYPTAGWLGRVHRGTPWQTVYLKASDIWSQSQTGPNTWTTWTGDQNVYDAYNATPIQDRDLFDLFTTALDDNASRGTLSVNQSQLAAWSAVLSGVLAISNSTPYSPRYDRPNYQTNVVINPAGADQFDSPLWQIVNGPNGINNTRKNFPLKSFTHLGDILSVPALTEQSPFINVPNGSVQQQYDVSDEIYEWLPQQTLGLLRLGSPRYVIYCYGQALRPAPGGTVLSSGLVTNYQVVAESAARAVMSVQPQVLSYINTNGTVTLTTNYTTRVENYNVLGPP